MGFSLGGLMLTALGSWAQVRKPTFIVMLFVVSALFGASAAVTLHFLGGRPIQPVTFMLPFILVYVLRMPKAVALIKKALVEDRAVLALIAFTVIAIMASIFSPLFFQGDVLVYNVEKGNFVLKALEFGGSHIAQIIYLLGAVVCFVIVVGLSRTPSGMEMFANALITLTAINALFGVLDLMTFYMGFPEALMFIKNAGYAMVDQSMHGIRRISGVFPETSAFSGFSVGLLGFNLALYLKGYCQRYTGILSLVTAFLLLMTTSSSAYLGLVGVVIMVIMIERDRLLRAKIGKNVFWASLLALGVAFFLLVVFTEDVFAILESAIFSKMESDSGIERMSWNHQAWNNLIDTQFWGVGLGGNRASSFLMVVLSNVGVIGLVAFLLFLGYAVRGRQVSDSKDENIVAAAAKAGALVILLPAMASATSFFLGMLFYILLGLGCSTVGIRPLVARE
ncbi:O-antigen ligase family protein [Microbulbifer sp. MCCC 1A16149]|uniref:O-antigen ligase family protein n=1 Tax=Microbulbifer sp. MCCC 1A16149 TaxID=3411322 RepID=UPI003D0ADC8B